MWRCFLKPWRKGACGPVCSTHVEMFLQREISSLTTLCLLHACGDVSHCCHQPGAAKMSAPRTWRCFTVYIAEADIVYVCSTHVEMFQFLL